MRISFHRGNSLGTHDSFDDGDFQNTITLSNLDRALGCIQESISRCRIHLRLRYRLFRSSLLWSAAWIAGLSLNKLPVRRRFAVTDVVWQWPRSVVWVITHAWSSDTLVGAA